MTRLDTPREADHPAAAGSRPGSAPISRAVARGVVKSPGVNLLLASDPLRRIKTLEAGATVAIVDGGRWLSVEVDGVAGLVPAVAIAMDAKPPGSVADGPATDLDLAAGSGIQHFSRGAHFTGDRVWAHADFHPALHRIDAYAELAGVGIHVIESFRRSVARPTTGSSVPPARGSNHLVGHAIDMNIIVSGERLDTQRLRHSRYADLPAEASYFVQLIRDDRELRWGGDFVRRNPVHIDDDLYRRDPAEWARKLREI